MDILPQLTVATTMMEESTVDDDGAVVSTAAKYWLTTSKARVKAVHIPSCSAGLQVQSESTCSNMKPG